MSHLALGSSNKDPPHFKVATLAPKLFNPLWMAPPLLFLDPVFSIQIDYHFVLYILSPRWNTLLRNQISLCQHVFYYIANKLLSYWIFEVLHLISNSKRSKLTFWSGLKKCRDWWNENCLCQLWRKLNNIKWNFLYNIIYNCNILPANVGYCTRL